MYNTPDFGLYTHEWMIFLICLIVIKYKSKIFTNNKLAIPIIISILAIFFTEKYSMIKYLSHIPKYVETIIPVFILVVLLDAATSCLYYLYKKLYYLYKKHFNVSYLTKQLVLEYVYHVIFNFFLMISLTITLYASGNRTTWLLSWIMIVKSFYLTNVVFNYLTWGWIVNFWHASFNSENRPEYYIVKRWR